MNEFNEDSLIGIIRTMVIRDPYFGFFTSNLNIKVTTEIPTAAVTLIDGQFYMLANPQFMASHTFAQQMGIVLHEVLHLILFHLVIGAGWNRNLANIAMDLEVNQMVMQTGLYDLPADRIDIANFRERYPELDWKDLAGSSHYYQELLKLPQEEQDKLQGFDHSFLDGLSEEEVEVLKERVAGMVSRVNSNYAGDIPGKIKELLESFKRKTNEVNWKVLLRRFICGADEVLQKQTRFKVNLIDEDRLSTKVKFKCKILVAVDTSGSVSDRELATFLNEIYHLYRCGYSVDLLCVDTQIYPPVKYTGGEQVTIHGRGGTYFTPVLEFYNKSKYSAMIYFTDGYAELPPKAKKPMMWVITPGGSIDAIREHNGKKIKLNNIISK